MTGWVAAKREREPPAAMGRLNQAVQITQHHSNSNFEYSF